MICRLCKKTRKPFLDLGNVPPPEAFLRRGETFDPRFFFPLGLSYCTSCGHVQLTHEIPRDIIYKQHYFYDYSVTKTGLAHWRKLASFLLHKYRLKTDDLVVDIGSNTGIFLSLLKTKDINIVGVDPATKLVNLARKNGIPTINAYFSQEVTKRIIKKYGKATVITCTNTFDHVDDLRVFMEGLQVLLSQNGRFIIEVPYFKTIVTSFTHIPYHQQIDYMLLTPLLPFFQHFGLEILDAQEIPLHGGSIRMFVYHKGTKKPSKRLQLLLEKEKVLLKNWPRKLGQFAEKIAKQRDDLISLVKKLKKDGKQIAGIGASAKGHTLLNYCHFGPQEISFITEKSPLKIGLYTPSGIPIVGDNELIAKKLDYALLLSWNFADEIMKNLAGYRKIGGHFIVPIPKITIL